MWILGFLKTGATHPRWFLDVLRVGVDTVLGRNGAEGHENGLKAAARRHGVDYHKFSE